MIPRHKRFTLCTVFPALLFLALFSSPAHAASAVEIDAKANAALTQFYADVPAGKELAEKSVGMLIFPSVVKAGLALGGEYGEGALRIGNQTVDYYSTVAGSLGLQAGVQSKSIVILFMTAEAIDRFRAGSGWEVGVDGGITLVTVGVGGAIDTTTAQEPIIGFVFGQKGLMGNLTLEGAKMTRIIR